ncbi:hypothetical protein ACXZ66_01040 [Corynebacterium sp. S7]
MKLRTVIAGVAAATAVALSPAVANADAVDDVLNALPSGQITCAQAERYWTNDADYNNKVAQANALAMFDSRGNEIRAALSRVDEAANRCGLKGGSTGGNAAPSQPAPSQPAPSAPQGQVISLAPQGVPSINIPVANVATITLPDVAKLFQELLATFNITLPAVALTGSSL